MAGKASAATALAAVLGGAGLMVLGFTSAANAHSPRVSASCVDGKVLLSVELLKYEAAGRNTVVVHDNGVQLVESAFGVEYRNKWTDLDDEVAHKFVVMVSAWDDPDASKGWSFRKEAEVPSCAPPSYSTTTVPSSTTSSSKPASTAPSSTRPVQSSSVAASSSSAVMTTSEVATPPAKPEALAQTGASPVPVLAAGGALLTVGAGAVIAARRRKSSQR